MRLAAISLMTFFGIMSNSYASQKCDFVQAALSNINSVAKTYGAKSFEIETKQTRSYNGSVAFAFIAANGQKQVGVTQVNEVTCTVEYYNVQPSISILVK